MLKSLLSILLITTVSHAHAATNQLFKCVEQQSLSIDSDCVERKISANPTFQMAQQSFFENLESDSGAELSTISFYPQQNLIKIQAPRTESLSYSKITLVTDK